MSCKLPSQEVSNGFCYDKCAAGFSGYGAMCLQDCPEGYADHGLTCEPPSQLRQTVKSSLQPCASAQVDRNGNCYEPQSITYVSVNGTQVPKITGCGCIRKTLAQRIQCPSGYKPYNNGCITDCPSGFHDILDGAGNINSMYCQKACPQKVNSKETWELVGDLCVKDYIKRQRHNESSTGYSSSAIKKTLRPYASAPVTMLSYLGQRPLGSSLNDRVRGGQSVNQSLGSGLGSGIPNPFSSAVGDSWFSLLLDPSKLLLFALLAGILIFGGPTFYRLFAAGIGSLAKGAGSAGGSVLTGTGTAAGAIVSSTGQVTADIEKAVGENVAATIARTASKLQASNAARPLQAQTVATQQLTSAREALNNVS